MIYVLGNHEYYHQNWDSLPDRAREAPSGSNVHLLENESVTVAGLKILGCSLWTDFALTGVGELGQTAAMHICRRVMTDYHLIRSGPEYRRLHPVETLRQHQASLAWLAAELSGCGEKVLVVTHHSPTPNNRNPRFPADEVTTAFNSNLHHLMDSRRIHAWISGHTHHSGVVEAGEGPHPVKVYSNQSGYPGERMEFSWDRCLEIMP